MELQIAKIRMDGGTQPRGTLNQEVIAEYAESMSSGASFPDADVFYDGSDYWLADGFHRVNAALAAHLECFSCTIHQGTREDAQWFSFGANKANGLYRSNADKQRAVQAALRHPKSVGMSDRAIAEHCGVSHTFVANRRIPLSGNRCQIEAERVTVGDPMPLERTITRNGTEYTMNVSKIGRTPSAAAPTRPTAATPQVGTKRRDIIDNSTRERMISGISMIRGACRGLSELNRDSILTALTKEERDGWAETIATQIRDLRMFAKFLTTGNTNENQ